MIPIWLMSLAASASLNVEHPAWMIGTWGWQNPGERVNDCGTDHDVTYARDGRYDFMDEVGTWKVVGNRLIETMTDPGGTGDPTRIGKPNVMTFTKVRRGVLRIAGPRGGTMFKCPG